MLPEERKGLVQKAVRTYCTMVFRIAYQKLKNVHDAEDVMQDVGVALMKGNPPFEDEEHLKAWIIRVTLNKCGNLRKSFWKSRKEPIDDYLELQAPETREALEELFELPEKYRTVLYLYYFEGYSIGEIAEILGKNKNTVGSNLRRARLMLKEKITQGGKDG